MIVHLTLTSQQSLHHAYCTVIHPGTSCILFYLHSMPLYCPHICLMSPMYSSWLTLPHIYTHSMGWVCFSCLSKYNIYIAFCFVTMAWSMHETFHHLFAMLSTNTLWDTYCLGLDEIQTSVVILRIVFDDRGYGDCYAHFTSPLYYLPYSGIELPTSLW